MADFLFELGVEEVPVSEAPRIRDQLAGAFRMELENEHLGMDTMEVAATNRRFMVYITGLPHQASDRTEVLTGPSKRIAYDDAGNPAVPLLKFLEANGTALDDVQEVETAKGVYMAVERRHKGQKSQRVFEKAIPRILAGLTFRKAMVWNDSRVAFIRPIRNILAILDGELIAVEFAGIRSSQEIDAHPLLAEDKLEIHSYRDYIEKLHKNFVIAAEREREKIILQDAISLAADLETTVEIDMDMLRYYVFNNEYPVVFSGEFDRRYLTLPQEIISEFMRNEKKLHPLHDSSGRMINHFIGVSNVPDEHRNVAGGNEKVIKATFEDASFFWESDRTEDFPVLREKLSALVFHEGLGSFQDKSSRIQTLVAYLCRLTNNNSMTEDLKKAAEWCKNDLVTRMVGEFPSLQGIMGGLYLRETGVSESIWRPVYAHYEPRGFTQDPINHLGGGLLSICDKIDNITAFLSKGIRSSSSSDPYGIRRDANAVIKVILDLGLDFSLSDLIGHACNLLVTDETERNILMRKVENLFYIRLDNIMRENLAIRHDVAEAVITNANLQIYRLYLKTLEISEMLGTPAIQPLVILHKRVKNISRSDDEVGDVVPEQLQDQEEKVLYETLRQTEPTIHRHLELREFRAVAAEILQMKPLIDNFFDNVLVMAKQEDLRRNRIALVRKIDHTLMQVADFSRIMESE
ncbi:MAG TPA: glycine--tRNA ligase subunit beta [Candidatus Aminicenantes bacterium]|nr:glycine--tRNA ligase subunit beta [Candidatus Aminicenantes bacterium]